MCPYIDRDDPRCAGRLTLMNLVQALDHCADHYQGCPVYLEILRDARTRTREPRPAALRPAV